MLQVFEEEKRFLLVWGCDGCRGNGSGRLQSLGWQKALNSSAKCPDCPSCGRGQCIIIKQHGEWTSPVNVPTIWSACNHVCTQPCVSFQHFPRVLCAAPLQFCGQQLDLIGVVSNLFAGCAQFITSAVMIPKTKVKD